MLNVSLEKGLGRAASKPDWVEKQQVALLIRRWEVGRWGYSRNCGLTGSICGSPTKSPPPCAMHTESGRLLGEALGKAWQGKREHTVNLEGGVTGPWGPRDQAVKTSGGGLGLCMSLLFHPEPGSREGADTGRWVPLYLPKTTLCLSPLLSPVSHPPSLLNFLLTHLTPSGVPSCSHFFLSPSWGKGGKREGKLRDHGGQSLERAGPPGYLPTSRGSGPFFLSLSGPGWVVVRVRGTRSSSWGVPMLCAGALSKTRAGARGSEVPGAVSPLWPWLHPPWPRKRAALRGQGGRAPRSLPTISRWLGHPWGWAGMGHVPYGGHGKGSVRRGQRL